MSSRGGGFTLIEVLVAMTVMAVMAMMAWQGVDGIVRARDASQGHLEQTLRLNTVIGQWDQDLASIEDPLLPGIPSSIACDGSTVRLIRRAEGGLQVVAWALRPAADSFTWWRWASPAARTGADLQDSWLRTQQFQGGEPGQLRAIDRLSGWQVYFNRGTAWTNCQSSAGPPVAVPLPGVIPAASGSASGGSSVGVPGPGGVAAASSVSNAGTPGPGGGAGGAGAGGSPPPLLRPGLPNGVRIVLTFGPGSGYSGTLTRDTLLVP